MERVRGRKGMNVVRDRKKERKKERERERERKRKSNWLRIKLFLIAFKI